MNQKFTLAIHGGAGNILKSKMPDEREANYVKVLNQALQAGHSILRDGGTSLDAVEQAIIVMENSELFNAGGRGKKEEQELFEKVSTVFWECGILHRLLEWLPHSR
jgi:isoaspartyl peptidase/L-asparaginase-like protein (Ntn-hydrolase superfamily)